METFTITDTETGESTTVPITRGAILALVFAWDEANPHERIAVATVAIPRTPEAAARAQKEAN